MVSAVIVAGGAGRRMRRTIRKQYIPLNGRPLLGHTLVAVAASRRIEHIYLVVPREDLEFCRQKVVDPDAVGQPVTIVPGGTTRQASVFNGIRAIEDMEGIAVVHDGVRPFIRAEQIDVCVEQAEIHDACILGIPAFDTLKRVDESGFAIDTIPRDTVWHSQTPQAFRCRLIEKAHEQALNDRFVASDDAQLVERLGIRIKMITGSRHNIKITTDEDLVLAEQIFEQQQL